MLEELRSFVDGVFEGPNGDYPAVLEALKGIRVEQALNKPSKECNSIWQIVDHLTASKVWEMEILEKGKAASPVWTEPNGDENIWQSAQDKLINEHKRLIIVLKKMNEENLYEIPVSEWKQTKLYIFLSLAAHEAYHSGQIDYVKGLLGAKT